MISEYDFFVLLSTLYANKELEGQTVAIRKGAPSRQDARRIVDDLDRERVLAIDEEFGNFIFRVVAVPDAPADDICCEVDPFCYVSHLSAMQRYNLTDRTPAELTLTTPMRALWNSLRDRKTLLDYGGTPPDAENAWPLVRISFPAKVRGRAIRRHESKHPGEAKQLRDSSVRLATIGRTFMDMLDRPRWCGGMSHVTEVWEEHAETYFEEIVAVVDEAPTSIVKMRAGYLLEERLGLRDARIEAWKQFAQRGSSRLLDPEGTYQPRWSDTWMISLNV